MKKEISSGVGMAIAAAAILIVGVLGYMMYARSDSTMGSAGSQAEYDQKYKQKMQGGTNNTVSGAASSTKQ